MGTLINTQLQLGGCGPARPPTVSKVFSTWPVRAAAPENRSSGWGSLDSTHTQLKLGVNWGEGRRKKEECRNVEQSHPKPHPCDIKATCMRLACDLHAESMRGACGMRSYFARIPLVFRSYSPRVLRGRGWRREGTVAALLPLFDGTCSSSIHGEWCFSFYICQPESAAVECGT
jgi:hypothetical protein